MFDACDSSDRRESDVSDTYPVLDRNERVCKFMEQDASEYRDQNESAEKDARYPSLGGNAPLINDPQYYDREGRVDQHVDTFDRTDSERSSHGYSLTLVSDS